jgi:predicted nucleic acid-binding protein
MVADASVLVSYLMDTDKYYIPTFAWFSRYVATNQQIIIPTIAFPEVGGPVARRKKQSAAGQLAINNLLTVPGVVFIDVDIRLARISARLAATLQLRGADAVYVTLAQRLGVPLISWDNDHINKTKGVITACTPLTAP